MSLQDLADYQHLLDSLIGETFEYSLATNSLKLRFFTEFDPRGEQYIWIDPPWQLYQNDELVFASSTYPLERGAPEQEWFNQCPMPWPLQFLSYIRETDGCISFFFSENFELFLPLRSKPRESDSWYDDWYVSIRKVTKPN